MALGIIGFYLYYNPTRLQETHCHLPITPTSPSHPGFNGVNVQDDAKTNAIVNTITMRQSVAQQQKQLRVTYLTQCPVQPAEIEVT